VPVVWDIETAPLPEDQLRALLNYPEITPWVDPGEFNPATVKLGNLKNQEKINEKLDDAKVAWDEARAKGRETHVATYEREKAAAEQALFEGAALSATTGQIVAIGYKLDGQTLLDMVGDGLTERDLLLLFWKRFNASVASKWPLVGFNIFNFDLPFLIRRSWLCEIAVPGNVLDKGRYWHPQFVDLAQVWQLGQYRTFISLDAVCRFFGLPGKNGSGADFHKLLAADRAAAAAYLANDLKITWEAGERMGVIF